MYYLQSRYYDANVGRFINADEIAFILIDSYLLGLNVFSYAFNNSIRCFDKNGYSATLAIPQTVYTLSASYITLSIDLKALYSMLWNVFVVVGLLIIAIALIVVICKTVDKVLADIEKALQSKSDDYKNYSGKYYVYVLTHKYQKKLSSVFYVGRTQNPVARKNAHNIEKGDCDMYIVYFCDTKVMSRVVEQAVLSVCLTSSVTNVIFKSKPSNMINGISSKAKTRQNAINALKKDTEAYYNTLSLLSCTSDSDLKLAMGK